MNALTPMAPGAVGAGGGGGGGSQQRAPFEAANTLRSKGVLRLLVALGEGEESLSDGLKSIFFDNLPVQASDGSYNFQGVVAEERIGTPTQSSIAGFPAASTTYNEGASVTASTPIVRTVSSANVDEVAVTIRIPALFFQNTANGDMLPTSVTWGVDVRISGGSWTRAFTDTIDNQKTTSPYERTRVVSKGNLTFPWEFRVVRDTADSGSSALQNSTIFGLYTERVNAKITYPDTHLISLSLDAEKLQGRLPAITFDTKGRKVAVPRNYDPATRVYLTTGAGTSMGDWDFATFHYQVCGNPAWAVYDLIVNDRFGLGDLIPDALADVFTLYAIAKYCDELVNDGYGGTEPRYRIATSITEREEAWKALQMVAGIFHGMVWAGNGQVRVTADMPKTPVKPLTNANVIDGKFTYEGISVRQRHTMAYVLYNDQNDGWRRSPEVFQDDAGVARYGLREAEVVGFGCAWRGQARRAAKWLIESDKHGETVTFIVGFDNADLMPGDVVEIMDRCYAGVSLGGRVVSATSTTITLDRQVTIQSGRTYYLTTIGEVATGGASEAQVQRERQVSTSPTTTNVLTMTSAFPNPVIPGSVWLLKEQHNTTPSLSVTPRQFTVLQMSPEGDHLFRVSAIEYDSTKFARVDSNNNFDADATSVLPSAATPIAPPTTVTAQEYVRSAGGSALVIVTTVSWKASSDLRASAYEVEVRGADGYRESRVVRAVTTDFEGLRKQNYTFAVRTLTLGNAFSAWAVSSTVLVDGVNDAPDVPTGFSVRQGVRELTLLWTNPTNLDLDAIQIKRSPTSTEASATVLKEISGTQWTDTDKDTLVAASTWYYWIRARNTSNQYSSWVGPQNATVQGIGVAIEDASILTAKIGDLQVSTIKVAGNALSGFVSSTTTTTHSATGPGYFTNTYDMTTVTTVTIALEGDGKVMIQHSINTIGTGGGTGDGFGGGTGN